MTTHTPGPWNVTGLYVRERDGGLIASILDLWHGQRTPKAKKNANARLIAAAPELLAALEELLCSLETDGDYSNAFTAAREVVNCRCTMIFGSSAMGLMYRLPTPPASAPAPAPRPAGRAPADVPPVSLSRHAAPPRPVVSQCTRRRLARLTAASAGIDGYGYGGLDGCGDPTERS